MEDLKVKIKHLIIDTLNLEGLTIDDIADEESLFVDGLGLDSIDALEIGLAIKKEFNIAISADNQEMRKHFYSINTLASFVDSCLHSVN